MAAIVQPDDEACTDFAAQPVGKRVGSVFAPFSSDQNSPPPVFRTIYQKVYAVLYLLSGSLKIPYPSPVLMKVVKMASPWDIFRPQPAKGRPVG